MNNDLRKEVIETVKDVLIGEIAKVHESNIELLISEWGTKDVHIALTYACGRAICLYDLGLITEETCDNLFETYKGIVESVVKPSCYSFKFKRGSEKKNENC